MEEDSTPNTGKKHLSSRGRLLDEAHFPILQGIAPILINILNSASNLMHVSEGVELLHEGDTTHDLYFIESGSVAIAKHAECGDKMLHELGAGDMFGEFGTLRGKVRFASVYTLEMSRIIRVKQEALKQVLELDATFRERLTQLMNHRMLSSFISSHPVFRDLSEHAIIELSDTLPLRLVAYDHFVFRQGELLDAACMIVSGEAELHSDGDVEVLLGVRRDNDILGAARDESGRAIYSAYASSDMELFELDQVALSLLRSLSAKVADQLDELLAQWAANTFNGINRLGT